MSKINEPTGFVDHLHGEFRQVIFRTPDATVGDAVLGLLSTIADLVFNMPDDLSRADLVSRIQRTVPNLMDSATHQAALRHDAGAPHEGRLH